MKKFRNRTFLRFAFFSAALAGFFMATLMAASPDLHAWMHEDAGHGQHECLATTLMSSGCDSAAPAPVFTAFCPASLIAIQSLQAQWAESDRLLGLPLDRGPPALC
jgi:hypothetical protein